MASIELRSNRYRAVIRRKNKQMSATFSEKEMAELWAKYHEDIIDAIDNFQAKPEEIITFEQCCELKKQDAVDRNLDKRSISDFTTCLDEFPELRNLSLNEITSDIIRELVFIKLNGVVRRGGNKLNINSGDIRKCSTATILRKCRVLASIFGFMIEKGANIINPAQIVVNQLKMSMIKNGEIDEE